MQSIRTSATVASGTTGRLTRADIEEHHARMISAATSSSSTGTGSNVVVVDEQPLEENINRLTVDGLEARSVDEAIKVLRYHTQTHRQTVVVGDSTRKDRYISEVKPSEDREKVLGRTKCPRSFGQMLPLGPRSECNTSTHTHTQTDRQTDRWNDT